MDRWPAAAFKAGCVLVEALDRLWHLVSTAMQRNDPETQRQRWAELLHLKTCQDERESTWDIWNGKKRRSKTKAVGENGWSRRKGLWGRIVKNLRKGEKEEIGRKEREGGKGNISMKRAWEGPYIALPIPCSPPIKNERGWMPAFNPHLYIICIAWAFGGENAYTWVSLISWSQHQTSVSLLCKLQWLHLRVLLSQRIPIALLCIQYGHDSLESLNVIITRLHVFVLVRVSIRCSVWK